MKDRSDIAPNTLFSDEAHFSLNAQVNKGLTPVSVVQKQNILIHTSLNEHVQRRNQ